MEISEFGKSSEYENVNDFEDAPEYSEKSEKRNGGAFVN
jgi:hypothetical protein